VLLIDDDEHNVKIALEDGHAAIHFDVNDPASLFGQLEALKR
jgi:hypothetical protein